MEVIPASVQDRDCAVDLIKKTRRLFPFVRHVFADGGYSGDKLATDLAAQRVTLEIVKRTDKEGGFKVIRRRWVVERTLSWLRRNRRLMAHYEAVALIAEGFAKLAMISVCKALPTNIREHCPQLFTFFAKMNFAMVIGANAYHIVGQVRPSRRKPFQVMHLAIGFAVCA